MAIIAVIVARAALAAFSWVFTGKTVWILPNVLAEVRRRRCCCSCCFPGKMDSPFQTPMFCHKLQCLPCLPCCLLKLLPCSVAKACAGPRGLAEACKAMAQPATLPSCVLTSKTTTGGCGAAVAHGL